MKLAGNEMKELDEETVSALAVEFLKTCGMFPDVNFRDYVARLVKCRQNKK